MLRVLVVEDEVLIGMALREELQDCGAVVEVKTDAESALHYLATGAIDVAIIDIALPGMRGDLFAAECRRRFPTMPIVLATGMKAAAFQMLFAADSRFAVLEKPYEWHALRECLEKMDVDLNYKAAPLA
jgi:CheY-like chemotaxis protein